MEEHIANIDNMNMVVKIDETSQGEPLVIIGPGDISKRSFSEKFRKNFQLIWCNMYTDRRVPYPGDNYTYQDYIDSHVQLLEWLKAKDSKRYSKVIVAGHSAFSIFVLGLGEQKPDLVKGVMVIAGLPVAIEETVFNAQRDHFDSNYKAKFFSGAKKQELYTEDDPRVDYFEHHGGPIKSAIRQKLAAAAAPAAFLKMTRYFPGWLQQKLWVKTFLASSVYAFVDYQNPEHGDKWAELPMSLRFMNHMYHHLANGQDFRYKFDKITVPVFVCEGMYDCWTPYTLWAGDDKLNVNLKPLIKEQLDLMERCFGADSNEEVVGGFKEEQKKISEDYEKSSRNKSYLISEVFDDLLKRQREIAKKLFDFMKGKFSKELIDEQQKLVDKSLGKFELPKNFILYICEAAHQVQDEKVGDDGLGGQAEFDAASEAWLKDNFKQLSLRPKGIS